jgi:hypothetical protein
MHSSFPDQPKGFVLGVMGWVDDDVMMGGGRLIRFRDFGGKIFRDNSVASSLDWCSRRRSIAEHECIM